MNKLVSCGWKGEILRLFYGARFLQNSVSWSICFLKSADFLKFSEKELRSQIEHKYILERGFFTTSESAKSGRKNIIENTNACGRKQM